jgi:hypothetical protein
MWLCNNQYMGVRWWKQCQPLPCGTDQLWTSSRKISQTFAVSSQKIGEKKQLQLATIIFGWNLRSPSNYQIIDGFDVENHHFSHSHCYKLICFPCHFGAWFSHHSTISFLLKFRFLSYPHSLVCLNMGYPKIQWLSPKNQWFIMVYHRFP